MPRSPRPIPTEAPGVRRRTLIGGVLVPPILPGASTGSRPLTARPVDTDAELIRLCAGLQALDGENLARDAEGWDAVLLRLCTLTPAGILALRAKVQLALTLLPSPVDGSCSARLSPEERLLCSVLQDVLVWTEHLERWRAFDEGRISPTRSDPRPKPAARSF